MIRKWKVTYRVPWLILLGFPLVGSSDIRGQQGTQGMGRWDLTENYILLGWWRRIREEVDRQSLFRGWNHSRWGFPSPSFGLSRQLFYLFQSWWRNSARSKTISAGDCLSTDTHPDQATVPDDNSLFEVTFVVGAAPAACAAYTACTAPASYHRFSAINRRPCFFSFSCSCFWSLTVGYLHQSAWISPGRGSSIAKNIFAAAARPACLISLSS